MTDLKTEQLRELEDWLNELEYEEVKQKVCDQQFKEKVDISCNILKRAMQSSKPEIYIQTIREVYNLLQYGEKEV